MADPPYLTLPEIWRKHFPNHRFHQIRHAVDTYRIEPRTRAGIVRLFAPDQVGEIRSALQRTTRTRVEVAHG